MTCIPSGPDIFNGFIWFYHLAISSSVASWMNHSLNRSFSILSESSAKFRSDNLQNIILVLWPVFIFVNYFSCTILPFFYVARAWKYLVSLSLSSIRFFCARWVQYTSYSMDISFIRSWRSFSCFKKWLLRGFWISCIWVSYNCCFIYLFSLLEC